VLSGTDALLAPPLVVDQLVGLVAFQLEEDPPPTQCLSVSAETLCGKNMTKPNRNSKLARSSFIGVNFLFFMLRTSYNHKKNKDSTRETDYPQALFDHDFITILGEE
jgi:hypothetical protein